MPPFPLRSGMLAGPHHVTRTLAAVLCAVFLCGCGSQLYEQRLKRTVEYFDYLDKLNQNLGKEWRGPGVSIRVPSQLNLVSAANEERSQQPDYIGLTLPGLLATWTCDVRVDGAEGLVPCYLYLTSNQDLLSRDKKDEATGFQQEVFRRVVAALKMRMPENSKWFVEDFPKTRGFVEQKQFNTITLAPNLDVHGVPADVSVYEFLDGDVQVTLLLIVPRQIDTREKVQQRMAYSLETLALARASRAGGSRPGRSGASF